MRLFHGLAKPVMVLIFGAPGSGKGTISNRLIKDFELNYLSSGDAFRRHISDKTELGEVANQYVSKGQLVPDDIVTKMMLTECLKYRDDNLLLDGFPRTVPQAKSLSEAMVVSCVLNLDVPFDELIRRVSCRWIHFPSGRIYNDEFNPPKKKGFDDVTGEPLTQREDDKAEVVQARLNAYQQAMEPLVDYYQKNTGVHTFKGRYSNELWPHVHKAFSKFLKPLQYTEYK